MMETLSELIYEYKCGAKPLALFTCEAAKKDRAVSILEGAKTPYCIRNLGFKINIFFGEKPCVEIIKTFYDKSLSDLTDEEDFILGIMLGYSRIKQCERYLSRKACVKA